MLKETYLQKRIQMPDAAFLVVIRIAGHLLGPSWNLLNDYKMGASTGHSTTERSGARWNAIHAIAEMKRIWDLSQTRDVYLVCFEKGVKNCHRHILI